MDFRSDNVASVAPDIMAAIEHANRDTAGSYGGDEISQRLDDLFGALFQKTVRVFPVSTGSVANALALSVMTPPYGAIYAHQLSHVNGEECGAPEFYSGGARVVGLDGEGGKIAPDTLARALAISGKGFVHCAQPAVLSLTQSTEWGRVYTPAEIKALSGVAQKAGLAVHMDGARFANAVASLGCTPADLTWRAGVEVLSFGATKNGALAVEAIVLFRTDLADDLAFRHKRAGQLMSKMRFFAAQLEAYLADDLWLKLAGHANRLAARLGQGLAALPGCKLAAPVEANEVFVDLPRGVIDGLKGEGAQFFGWPEPWSDSTTIRLVTRHDMAAEEVERLLEVTTRLAIKARRSA
ncbi:MAG: low specificity L-threonine aldolase [Alphaproteobacteria bacterium]|nr:low specificity L-threonine aldolase [Alphaproteobacteria bacterium]